MVLYHCNFQLMCQKLSWSLWFKKFKEKNYGHVTLIHWWSTPIFIWFLNQLKRGFPIDSSLFSNASFLYISGLKGLWNCLSWDFIYVSEGTMSLCLRLWIILYRVFEQKVLLSFIYKLCGRQKHSFVANFVFPFVDQEERTKAIEAFRDGKKDVLVATDVASKGLDFPAIQHVINYDMPEEIENYGMGLTWLWNSIMSFLCIQSFPWDEEGLCP